MIRLCNVQSFCNAFSRINCDVYSCLHLLCVLQIVHPISRQDLCICVSFSNLSVQVGNHMSFFLSLFFLDFHRHIVFCFLFIVLKSITSGTSNNIALSNVSSLGYYFVTCDALVLRACDAVASALSMTIFVSVRVLGGSECINVLHALPTVKCMRSHIPFQAGLRLVVGTSLILKLVNNF